jgi:uncharacterized membrane protein YsdA (DUF1294 family)
MSTTQQYTWAALGFMILLASLLNFILYGLDKRRARRQERRIPEKTFHFLGILGGWPGAMCGAQVFRHKTRKLSYRFLFWIAAIIHCTGLYLVWHFL